MSKTVYLACKFAEKEKINSVSEELEKAGVGITVKWWFLEQKDCRERTFEESQIVGSAEVNGIVNSDALICFLTDPEYPYKGTLCELGIALGAKVPIMVIVPEGASNKTHKVLWVPHVYCANTWSYLPTDDWTSIIPNIMEFLGHKVFMEEQLCKNTHNKYRIKIHNDIIQKTDKINYNKNGKITWFYTLNGKRIIDRIENNSTLSINTMTIGETIFDSENGLYECKFDIGKCHVDFGIGMHTVNNCDFMGYDHAIYFIKCNNDPSYPDANIEFNDSYISLSILLKEKSFRDSDIMKIHINYY